MSFGFHAKNDFEAYFSKTVVFTKRNNTTQSQDYGLVSNS